MMIYGNLCACACVSAAAKTPPGDKEVLLLLMLKVLLAHFIIRMRLHQRPH